MSLKSYKYRLYPTRKQQERLQWTLERARELYNAALQERRDAYRMAGKSITYYDQANQLPEIKDIREEYKNIHSQVLQDVLRKADKTFQRFFERCKRGATPGYPRFKGKGQYDSFTYPQTGFALTHDNRVGLSKIGRIKVKLHRALSGKVKTCTIKREGEHWYIVFACEVETQTLPVTSEDVGIDLGVMRLATLSHGETIEHPRSLRKAEKQLQTAQQALSRKKRESHRRKKAVKAIARLHRQVRNQRQDFLHKQSRTLVNRYQLIVFEELEVAKLTKRPKPKQDENGKYLPNGASAKAGLNKSILDAGWGMFVQMTQYKAASAGRSVLFVNPRFTSQICSACGEKGPHKDLSERTHICPFCGIVLDRDHNAAINILVLGRSLQAAQAS